MATTTAPNYSLTFGRTDAAFVTETERDYDIDGFPFSYEYTALPYKAEVDVRFNREADVASYADALEALRGLLVQVQGTTLIARLNASDGTGMSFVATGWLPLDEALETVESIQSRL